MLQLPIPCSVLLSILGKYLPYEHKIRDILLRASHVIGYHLVDIQGGKIITEYGIVVVENLSKMSVHDICVICNSDVRDFLNFDLNELEFVPFCSF